MLVNKKSLTQLFLALSTLCCLFLTLWLGSKAVLGFLAFGTLFFVQNYKGALLSFRNNFLLFMFPIWAGVTVLWAVYPIQALRLDIQLFLTFFIFLSVIHSCPLIRLLEMLCALFSITLLSVHISSETVEIFQTGEIVRVGVLGSKNNVSMIGASTLTAGVMLLSAPDKSRLSWILGVVAIALAISTIIQSKSLGTFLAILISGGVGILILNMNTLIKSDWLRKVVVYSSVITMVVLLLLIISLFSYESYASMMQSLGKDPTITGRTFIWAIGIKTIENNFWTGLGLQSFWSERNPDAILIWISGSREIGAPYGFHNLYIHTWVETGFFGFIIISAIMMKIVSRIIWFLECGCTIQEAAAAAFAFFLVMKSFIEVPIFGVFSINTFFFFVIWVVLNKTKGN